MEKTTQLCHGPHGTSIICLCTNRTPVGVQHGIMYPIDDYCSSRGILKMCTLLLHNLSKGNGFCLTTSSAFCNWLL